jgi:Na+/proline symporter
MRQGSILSILLSTDLSSKTEYWLVPFLGFTMVGGLWASTKVTSFKSYVLAEKKYGVIPLVATFLATHIGAGNILDTPNAIYREGIIVAIPFLGLFIAFLFRAFIIAPRMASFDDCLTMGDVMGKLYGKSAQFITGLLGTFYSVCIATIQLLGLGIITESLLGLSAGFSIPFMGALLLFYSALGGIKAVIFTDSFHLVVMVLAIVLLASWTLFQVGGVAKLYTLLPAEELQIIGHPKLSYYITNFILWSILSTGITSPPTFQRLLMARNTQELKQQYLVVSLFDPIFQFIILLIGLSAIILVPVTVGSTQVVPYLVQSIPSELVRIIITIGLLAVVMSTLDSYFHAGGVSLTQDIISPYRKTEFDKIYVSKWMTWLVGITSMLLTCFNGNMLGLVFIAMQATGPILLVPLLAGLLDFKADKRCFMVAAVITSITFIIARSLLPIKHTFVLVSILANGASFFGAHLIFKYLGNHIDRLEKFLSDGTQYRQGT